MAEEAAAAAAAAAASSAEVTIDPNTLALEDNETPAVEAPTLSAQEAKGGDFLMAVEPGDDATNAAIAEAGDVASPGFPETACPAKEAEERQLAEEETDTTEGMSIAIKTSQNATDIVPVETNADWRPAKEAQEEQTAVKGATARATNAAHAKEAENEEMHDAGFLCLLCLTKEAKDECLPEEVAHAAKATNIAAETINAVQVTATEEPEISAGSDKAAAFPIQKATEKQPMAEEPADNAVDAAKA